MNTSTIFFFFCKLADVKILEKELYSMKPLIEFLRFSTEEQKMFSTHNGH